MIQLKTPFKTQLKTVAVACSLSIVASGAFAADKLKPGEWQLSVKMTMKGGPQIPPEQLEKMKQLGIKTPFGGEPMLVTRCVTPEEASMDKPFQTRAHGDDGCQLTDYKRSPGKATGKMVCNGEIVGEGPFEMTLDSDTAYHGGWAMKGVSKHAGPVDQTTEISGKWIADQCTSKN